MVSVMQAQQTGRRILIERVGAASALRVRQAEAEVVGHGEVAIAVSHSGVNFADVQMRLGLYPDAPPRPFVPGYEVSGTIEAVGTGVTGFKVGDKVVAGTFFGGYASRVVIPAYQVFPLPSHLDLAEGAALPVNYFTAWLALHEMGRVRAGDRVLIECASGGVGTLAIQMARHAGAEVVGLTTTPAKKAYIEGLGAQAFTREEFAANRALKGFDFILNASGGKALGEQMGRLDLTGRMVCIGVNAIVRDGRRDWVQLAKLLLAAPRFPLLELFDRNVGVFGLNALHVLADETWVRRLTAGLGDIGRMGLRPHVGKVFAASEVAEAHAFLETKRATGKVLLAW